MVDVNDSEGQLKNLIEYIKKISDLGHSFDVVVDPDNKDYTKKFAIDGDGSFNIKEISIEDNLDEK